MSAVQRPAIVPVVLAPVDMNAFQLGEPNFTRPIAGIIRSGEAGNTAAKIATYVLSRLFAAIIALIPGLGAYLVGKTIAEYTRQNNQAAVSTNAQLRQLSGGATQANQNMAAMERTLTQNAATIAAQQPTIAQQANRIAELRQSVLTLQTANQDLGRQLGTAQQEIAELRPQLKSGSNFNYGSLTTPIKTAE